MLYPDCLRYLRCYGFSLDLAKSVVKDARCIYATGCSFDEAILFIQENVEKNSGHYFIVGGYFAFVPHRRSVSVVQSLLFYPRACLSRAHWYIFNVDVMES